VEEALRGKPASAIADAARHAADKVEALGDNYASADYRRHLAQIYVRRALQEALSARRK
jgi:carbon-monoxide dehydrogenase medium subunit